MEVLQRDKVFYRNKSTIILSYSEYLLIFSAFMKHTKM